MAHKGGIPFRALYMQIIMIIIIFVFRKKRGFSFSNLIPPISCILLFPHRYTGMCSRGTIFRLWLTSGQHRLPQMPPTPCRRRRPHRSFCGPCWTSPSPCWPDDAPWCSRVTRWRSAGCRAGNLVIARSLPLPQMFTAACMGKCKSQNSDEAHRCLCVLFISIFFPVSVRQHKSRVWSRRP